MENPKRKKSEIEKAKEIMEEVQRVESRDSLFDQLMEPAWGNRATGFKGIYMLALYLLTVGILLEALVNFAVRGELINAVVFGAFSKKALQLTFFWSCVVLYSLTAFAIQKLLLLGTSITVARIFQHATQSFMFLAIFVVIVQSNWFVTHNLTLGMTAIIMFFKMHSYTSVNLELRENYLKNKNSVYPSNITFANYLYFLVLPTFVYCVSYQRKSTIRIGYLIKKGVLFLLAILKSYQLISNYLHPYCEEYIHN